MKVILEIKEEKAAFVMELLKSLDFVKAKPLTPRKSEIYTDLAEAVDEVNQIKAGKKKAKSLSQFLNEL